MLVVMKNNASELQIEAVNDFIRSLGFTPEVVPGIQRSNICVLGNKTRVDSSRIEMLDGVQEVIHVSKPYKLVSREGKESSIVKVGSCEFGGNFVPVAAGPCSIEDRTMFLEIADILKEMGASVLRGGAFKPRTSPYAFQGLGEEGLKILAEARERTGLPVCTEVMDSEDLEIVSEYADIVQIGARNMHNFSLLRKVGRQKRAVLLKRGFAATISEFLMAAEYIVSEGNWDVILCERGIRTFEGDTRFTLDISVLPIIHEYSHLPVIIDPSHAIGRWNAVGPLARAAVAANADGLIVEVHQRPLEALSDGAQSLKPKKFEMMMREIKTIAAAIGRSA